VQYASPLNNWTLSNTGGRWKSNLKNELKEFEKGIDGA
jgi:hypothetical protein